MASSDDDAQIGKRIRLIRKEHGVSQRLTAAQVGLSRQQLDRIERGEVAIRFYPGVSFCEFAEINPLWLAFGDPETRYGCPNEEYIEAAIALDAAPRDAAEPTFFEFMKRNREHFRGVSLIYTYPRQPNAAGKKRLGRLALKHYLMPEMRGNAPRTWDELRNVFVSFTQSAEAKKEIKERLGVTLAAISQWRSGASAPTADNALQILDWITRSEANSQQTKKSAGVTASAQRRSKLRRKSKHEKQPSSDRKQK